MIVIGVDVDKQSVTAVAVDGAGRPLAEKTSPVGSDELVGWASTVGAERLWALEDCRQLTPWLERQLLSVGEELVRVPPKLTVPERRAGRARGKSDPIDALAIARAALRESDLSRLEMVEAIEISLYLLGLSAYARAGEDFGARLCAEALGTEAVHRALMRYAQGQLGKDVGVPNDVGFENFDWQSLTSARNALEGLGIGYGVQTDQPGRFYEYPGDPIANGTGTPVSHTRPQ